MSKSDPVKSDAGSGKHAFVRGKHTRQALLLGVPMRVQDTAKLPSGHGVASAIFKSEQLSLS